MPPGNFQPPVMTPHSSRSSTGLLIALILAILLFLGASGFAYWAYGGRQDYKNNVDQKINQAVDASREQLSIEKDKEFAEKEKNPYKQYKGPSTFASVDITYPKTWSAFVTESPKLNTPIEGYFHPVFVPGVQSGTAFALRIQVSDQPYDAELKKFDSKVKGGKVKVSPFKAAKVPSVLGSRVEGEINTGQKDTMVLFPVRDKTLKIWTESDQFINDFNNIVLPALTFVP